MCGREELGTCREIDAAEGSTCFSFSREPLGALYVIGFGLVRLFDVVAIGADWFEALRLGESTESASLAW